MQRTTTMTVAVLATMALLLAGLVSGCGGSGSTKATADPSPTGSAKTGAPAGPSGSPSASPSAGSTSPTGMTSATPSAGGPALIDAAHPGRLLLVPADQAALGNARCRPAAGLICASGKQGYRFQPGSVHAVKVVSAEVSEQAGAWVVTLALAEPSVGTLTRLSRTAMRTRQLLLLIAPAGSTGHRRLISAPQVAAPIVDGQLQISGSFTRGAAEKIVTLITPTVG